METGNYITLNGIDYPIYYDLKIYQKNGKIFVDMRLFMGDDYPITPLLKQNYSQSTMGEIVISLNPDKKVHFLHIFFMYPIHKTLSLPEEQAGVRGLGKKLLRLILNQLIETKLITGSDDIKLEASGHLGGEPSLPSGTTVEIALRELKKYPATYKDLIQPPRPTDEDILETYQSALENLRLVEYYKKLSFKVVDDSEAMLVRMRTTISELMQKLS